MLIPKGVGARGKACLFQNPNLLRGPIPGAQDSSKRTHEAIRRVLDAHSWPLGMARDFYLQGSYRNNTNIRGDSDVDVVLEMTSAFHHDTSVLSQYEQDLLSSSFQPAWHDWNDFRIETLRALETGFGEGMVSQGNKSIMLKADPPRLAADVVVCMKYRRYTSYSSFVEGITFQALRDKRWIVNYPKEHYKNGAAKSERTWDRYKRTVRMYKNARNHLESTGKFTANIAPSYFVECFLYNAPESKFKQGFQETYFSIVKWMVQNNLDKLVCQNGQERLFGSSPEQWNLAEAKTFANQLVSLWNNWN